MAALTAAVVRVVMRHRNPHFLSPRGPPLFVLQKSPGGETRPFPWAEHSTLSPFSLVLVVHNGFDELARKTLTSVDPGCQRMVLAWISNYDIQHLPAAAS